MRVVACHGGAGFRNGLSDSCLESLRKGGGALGTVTVMEDDPVFNCGRGSNLNWEGGIECEASYMDSFGKFGAVSSIGCVKSPTFLAQCIAENRSNITGLIPPMILTADGAKKYAQKIGISLCNPEELITNKAKLQWEKARNTTGDLGFPSVNDTVTVAVDTVGAVEINDDGSCVACCSSGGILLKYPGRMGQSAVYGAGCWAEQEDDLSVAIVTSGLGEAIIRTNMARGLAEAIINRSEDILPIDSLSQWLDVNFNSNKSLNSFPLERRLAGALILIRYEDMTELIICRNSVQFPVAYSDSRGKTRKLKNSENIGKQFSILSLPM